MIIFWTFTDFNKVTFQKIPIFCNFISSLYVHMGQSIQKWAKENLWKTAFKKFEGVWADHTPSKNLNVVLRKFYLVHYWIYCPLYINIYITFFVYPHCKETQTYLRKLSHRFIKYEQVQILDTSKIYSNYWKKIKEIKFNEMPSYN